MDFEGCHRCRQNYSHEAMAVDMEIRQRVTEFKGIFRIDIEKLPVEVPFIIGEITNEVVCTKATLINEITMIEKLIFLRCQMHKKLFLFVKFLSERPKKTIRAEQQHAGKYFN